MAALFFLFFGLQIDRSTLPAVLWQAEALGVGARLEPQLGPLSAAYVLLLARWVGPAGGQPSRGNSRVTPSAG